MEKTTYLKIIPLSALWLLVVFSSLFWNLEIFDGTVKLLALSEARSLFQKDVFFRRWASIHGGVYVPVTKDTQPNPYLDVPDRDVVTTRGKKLTLINPAYMVRQVHEMMSAQGGILTHITSLKPIRPQNKPDPWEAEALKKFESGLREYNSIEIIGGKRYIRFMGALLVEKPCLQCHEKQGYKEGDVRGGISVSLPLGRFAEVERGHRQSLIFWHFAIGLFGLVAILIGQKRFERSQSARFKAEIDAHRYSERHALLQNLGEGVYGMNAQGICTIVNPAALAMLGYREDEVVGQNAHELFHHHYPDGREFPASECDMHKALETGERTEGETCFFRKNGEMFPAHFMATPVESSSREHGFVVVVAFQDVSVRKKIDQELQLAASVYQHSSESIIITDEQNRILAVNSAFTRLTGYSFDEVKGKTPKILSSGRQSRNFYHEMWQSLKSTGHWQGEIWNKKKNGEIYPEWLSINCIYNPKNGSVSRYLALFYDITEKKLSEEVIERQANYDMLTGLPNRSMFNDRLSQEIKKANRSGLPLTLMYIDLDQFKEVNDSLGHDSGDILLKEAARRIVGCARESDTVARLGGDEFTIILSEMGDIATLERIAHDLIEKLSAPFLLGKESVFISASIGITLYPNDADNVVSLLSNADQAMYVAKAAGRNRFAYFTADLQLAAQRRLRLSNELRSAISSGQFRLYYQPIVDLKSGHISKAEALIRWNHPTRGLVGPAEFISLAEETGMIVEIGDWVFREALREVKKLRENHIPDFQISVNKSPVQFVRDGLIFRSQMDYMQQLDLPGQCIVIEITEGLLMDAKDVVKEKLLCFRDAGVQVALDDFGTGYSSLAYLKKFDIDYIKIDQSFVGNLEKDPNGLAVCEAIIVMAHRLGLKVIAEGIETAAQRDILAEAGCDYGQGYLFSPPLPAEEFENLLKGRSLDSG